MQKNFFLVLFTLNVFLWGYAPSYTNKHQEFFLSKAKALLGAYEQLGELAEFYDESGHCGPDCSVWLFQSANPSLKSCLVDFVPLSGPGMWGPLVGRYKGYLVFWDKQAQEWKRMNLELLYTGEDLSARLNIRKLAIF